MPGSAGRFCASDRTPFGLQAGPTDNDYVTKGVKFRSSLFKGLQVQGGALVAPRRERNILRIFPEGAFFFAYFLFAIEKESKRRTPCNRVPRKYTPVGCFARTAAISAGPEGSPADPLKAARRPQNATHQQPQSTPQKKNPALQSAPKSAMIAGKDQQRKQGPRPFYNETPA